MVIIVLALQQPNNRRMTVVKHLGSGLALPHRAKCGNAIPNPRYRRRLAVWAMALGLLVPAPAAAVGYVFFFSVLGEWAVTCSLDEPTGLSSCTLGAPPPVQDDARSLLSITEEGANAFTVKVRVLGLNAPRRPLFLGVDENPPHQAWPDRYGEASWDGAAAGVIVGQMKTGLHLHLRSFVEAPGTPKDETFSLAEFAKALALFRAKLRAHGIIASGKAEIR